MVGRADDLKFEFAKLNNEGGKEVRNAAETIRKVAIRLAFLRAQAALLNDQDELDKLEASKPADDTTLTQLDGYYAKTDRLGLPSVDGDFPLGARLSFKPDVDSGPTRQDELVVVVPLPEGFQRTREDIEALEPPDSIAYERHYRDGRIESFMIAETECYRFQNASQSPDQIVLDERFDFIENEEGEFVLGAIAKRVDSKGARVFEFCEDILGMEPDLQIPQAA